MKKMIYLLVLLGICITLISFDAKAELAVQQLTKSKYKDLSITQEGDIINISYNNNQDYLAMRAYFYYLGNNQTYTFSEAAFYGVTYDFWVNRNDGTNIKWGGKVDLTFADQAIKDNGYYVVFQYHSKSDGMTVIKNNGYLLLNDEVYYYWRDNESETNKFTLYNATTAFLSDNGSPFYDTVIYDPEVIIGNVSVGVFNQTYYNLTENYIQVNQTYVNGTYLSLVQNTSNLSAQISLNHSVACANGNCDDQVKYWYFTERDNLWTWWSFEDADETILPDISGNERDLYPCPVAPLKENFVERNNNRGYDAYFQQDMGYEDTSFVTDIFEDKIFSMFLLYSREGNNCSGSMGCNVMALANTNGQAMYLFVDELRFSIWGGRDLGFWEYSYSTDKEYKFIGVISNSTSVCIVNGSQRLYCENYSAAISVANGFSLFDIDYNSAYSNYTMYDFLIYNATLNFDQIGTIETQLNNFHGWNSSNHSNITANYYQLKAILDDSTTVVYNMTALVENATAPPVGGDTCTCPGSGDWNINCADNCVITDDCIMPNNDVHTYGTGTLTIRANINANNIFNRCDLFCYNTPTCFS